jgi:choline dehydrogenase
MLFSQLFFALTWAAFSTSLPLREQFLAGSNFGVPADATYDYVIVGGGTAGLTLAARLAKTNSVAVIEAGSFYELGNGNLSQIPLFDAYFIGKDPKYFNPSVDWGFVTTPQVVRIFRHRHVR